MSEAKKSMPLHTKILWSLLAGTIFGIVAQFIAAGNPDMQERVGWVVDKIADPVGNIFLAMIFMIVVPLLLSALILGIGELGDVVKVGRIGIRTLVMTVIFSGIAVALAFGGVWLVKPGSRISTEKRDALYASYGDAGREKLGMSAEEIAKEKGEEFDASESDIDPAVQEKIDEAVAKVSAQKDPPVFGIVPKNPMREATRALSGGILPFMFFALVFGIAMTKIDPEKAIPLRQFFEGLFEVSQKVIDMAMSLAPIGVFALMFKTSAVLGLDIFKVLGIYIALVLVLLAIHQFGVYSVLLKLIAKRNPMQFFKQMRNVMLTAFATSSSNATLPVALKDATDEVGLPKEVSSFVLTVGATANQNGTALFEGVTIIFLCQLFGVGLTSADQFQILLLAIVAGIGTAGVPGGAWPVIGSIIQRFGVPGGAIGLVLGVDRILDMSRTVLNVTGDMAIACCVAEWEGKGTVIPEEAME